MLKAGGGERNVHVFQQLFRLSIISRFDLIIVKEVFLCGAVGVDLESVAVERVVFLTPADVADCDWVDFYGALVGFWAIYVGGVRWGAVFVGLVVMKDGVDVLRAGFGGGGELSGLGTVGGSGGRGDYGGCSHVEVWSI